MPPLDEALRTPATKVDGCASQVWLVPVGASGGAVGGAADGPAPFDFRGDSDAMIVRGLIAVLHALLADLDAEQVLRVDVPAEFGRLGLDAHLSAQRSNGVRAMVARLRAMAGAMLHNA
jgi:cysteine desulfuration protein SufE